MALGGMFCLRDADSWLWEADSASGKQIHGSGRYVLPPGIIFVAVGSRFCLRDADSWLCEAYFTYGKI